MKRTRCKCNVNIMCTYIVCYHSVLTYNFFIKNNVIEFRISYKMMKTFPDLPC